MKCVSTIMYVGLLLGSCALPANTLGDAATNASVKKQLVGTWHLVHIDDPDAKASQAPNAQPTGLLIYTPDGYMSVQLMYPMSAKSISNDYVRQGYEASFGQFDVNAAAHTVTHHVQGSVTGDRLVGQDLPRAFRFDSDGRLIIHSADAAEHWSVTWKH